MPKRRVLILLYHQIDRGNNPKYYSNFISKESFEKHIAFPRKHGYSFFVLKDLIEFFKGSNSASPRSVVVAFDDGYLDNLTNAWPILKRYGAKGTIFLTTEFIGKSITWDEQENPFLTREQILELSRQGMEFGSHTLTHPSHPRCSLDKIIYDGFGFEGAHRRALG